MGEWSAPISPVKSRWPKAQVGLKLTDKRIEFYRKHGYYSAEIRQARRELWEMRERRRDAKRVGNFLQSESGSLIYSPR